MVCYEICIEAIVNAVTNNYLELIYSDEIFWN